MIDDDPRPEMPDEPPPFLGNWTRVYAVVACYVAIVIFAFWLFTQAFAE